MFRWPSCPAASSSHTSSLCLLFPTCAEFGLLQSQSSMSHGQEPTRRPLRLESTTRLLIASKRFPSRRHWRPLNSSASATTRHRAEIMASRREGLTAIYNRFHSPHEVSDDIAQPSCACTLIWITLSPQLTAGPSRSRPRVSRNETRHSVHDLRNRTARGPGPLARPESRTLCAGRGSIEGRSASRS